MSEENKKKEERIVVEIDRSAELQRLQDDIRELELKNQEYQNTLEEISNRQFQARCKKYKLDPNSTTPEELRDVELRHSSTANVYAPAQQTGVPVNKQEYGEIKSPDLPVEFWEFDSLEDAMKAIKEQASDPSNPERQKEAQQIVQKLAKRSLKHGGEWEMQGGLAGFEKKGNKIIRRDKKVKPTFKEIEENE